MDTTYTLLGSPEFGVQVAKADGPRNGRGVMKSSVRTYDDTAAAWLLETLRANAPGWWSDDRLAQSRHYTGITYLAIRTVMDGVSRAVPEVTEEADPDESPGRREKAVGAPGDHGKDSDRKPVPTNHWLPGLLANPNPIDTWADFVGEWVLQKELTGNALIWAVPDGLGDVAELWVLPTALCQPQPRSPRFPGGAWRVMPFNWSSPWGSLYNPTATAGATIDARMILHDQYKHPLFKFDGYSPLTGGAVQIDIMEAIDRSRHSAMEQGVTPGGVMTGDPMKGATEIDEATIRRIEQKMAEKYASSRNYGKMMILPGGWDVKAYSTAAGEMGYESGWEQMTSFGLALYRSMKGIVGLDSAESYAKLYAELKQFKLLTLDRWCMAIGQFLTKHLAKPSNDRLGVFLRLEGLDDPQLHEEQLKSDVNIMSVNQRLRGRNLPAVRYGEYPEPVYLKLTEAAAMAANPDLQPAPAQQPGVPGTAPGPGKPADGTESGSPEAERPDNDQGAGSLPPKLTPAVAKADVSVNRIRKFERKVLARLSATIEKMEAAHANGHVRKGYDPDEPRDESGQWGAGGGAAVAEKPAHAPADSPDGTGNHWLAAAKKIGDRAMRPARRAVKAVFKKIEARYGPANAKRIMSAIAIGTAAIPLPGGSLIAAAPFVAFAELHRQLSGAPGTQEKWFEPWPGLETA